MADFFLGFCRLILRQEPCRGIKSSSLGRNGWRCRTLASRPMSPRLTPASVPQLCTPGIVGSVYSAIDRTILRQPFRLLPSRSPLTLEGFPNELFEKEIAPRQPFQVYPSSSVAQQQCFGTGSSENMFN